MARVARIVVPGYPHHVTQRGNRRQRVFFGNSDYRAYIALMGRGKGVIHLYATSRGRGGG